MWRNIVLVFVLYSVVFIKCQFSECHDDSNFNPDDEPLVDLQSTWLGALQYIHVKNGAPHYFRVPRVILISRQFTLCTAVDAAQIPAGYALGNVIFGDYERDEEECDITIEDVASGIKCKPAILLMPIADVLLHPEYKHFGVKNSVALLKLLTPVKSKYMLPACLPFMDYLFDQKGNISNAKLFHVDFTNDVPRDFIYEDKLVQRVSILPRERCYLYDNASAEILMKMTPLRMACTTGCGFHSGAPTLVHEHTGHWSIVALSQGSLPCPDPMRPLRRSSPPLHILVHPYVPWITTAISGKPVASFAKDNPFGIMIPRTSRNLEPTTDPDWVGHWWLGGRRCHDRGPVAKDIHNFYNEVFRVTPDGNADISYSLVIECENDTRIVCVKVYLPSRLGQPSVTDIDTSNIKLNIPLLLKPNTRYQFMVSALGCKQ